MKQLKRDKIFPLALLLLLSGMIICPLMSVFARAVISDGRLNLLQAWAVIASTENIKTICNSLALGFSVLLCSTVIAAPTAFLLARTRMAQYSWLDILFMIPFMTPPYIASMAGFYSCRKGDFSSSFFLQRGPGRKDFSAFQEWSW